MNLYVANLSFKLGNDDLRQAFEPYGEVVSAKVIMDRETGRSRGFGFVEMAQRDDALQAIENLNGVDISGKVIAVSEARPRPEGQGNGGGGGQRREFRRY